MFSIGDAFDVPSRSASLPRHCDADSKHKADLVIPASSVLFFPRGLTSLRISQTCIHLWLSEYHPSEVLGFEGPSDVL